ncbi:MAG: SDR family NAD(P)-dependent oxidoreductase [Ginsengibacter sp.]
MKTPRKKVVIIGATSGIGRELAKIYARQGFFVGVSGRRLELLQSLQKEFPDHIVFECFDVTGNENIVHLRNLIEKLEGVDIIVYCSGYGEVSKELDWEIEKQTTAVNVNGFVEITSYAFNYLLNQQHGQIACISSIASTRGNGHAPAYSASKAYESIYMEGLYLKARKLNRKISVTDIQPGFVNTSLAKGNKFWVAPVEKAASQIFEAISRKRKRAYVTKRWWLIAVILTILPTFVLRRIG